LFDVVILPVSDADRSPRFYRDQLGFELDVDYAPSPISVSYNLLPTDQIRRSNSASA
jgi:catechol 2,3-dioxygenase-like lactoylglutathione lyase family enzyme